MQVIEFSLPSVNQETGLTALTECTCRFGGISTYQFLSFVSFFLHLYVSSIRIVHEIQDLRHRKCAPVESGINRRINSTGGCTCEREETYFFDTTAKRIFLSSLMHLGLSSLIKASMSGIKSLQIMKGISYQMGFGL